MGRTPKLTSHAFSSLWLRSLFLRILTLQTGYKESKPLNSCTNETARRCSPGPLRFPDWPTSIFSLLHSSSSIHNHSQAPPRLYGRPSLWSTWNRLFLLFEKRRNHFKKRSCPFLLHKIVDQWMCIDHMNYEPGAVHFKILLCVSIRIHNQVFSDVPTSEMGASNRVERLYQSRPPTSFRPFLTLTLPFKIKISKLSLREEKSIKSP